MTAHDSADPIRSTHVRLAELPRQAPSHFHIALPDDTLTAMAARLDLLGLRKVSLAGRLVPVGRDDWDLAATLGATVVQPCVSTLAPVTTRIDAEVERRYRADADTAPAAQETEMPEDDAMDPLPATLDLATVLEEALALALPLYPRAGDADDDEGARQFAPPGVTPLTDDDLKPLAGLADLKRRMSGDDPD